MLIHVVNRGETLWQLAALYNVSIDAIQSVNQLPNPNRLLLGQSLVIPVPGSIHTIQPGETLWSIARQYNVTVNAIL
ncbi:Spore germination protein OS=Ureibacillus acetophenoni OX=614649 GN=SAMN05877842_105141 PE=4 SV=1 [Ureibacillus acetophenoni]